MADARRSPISAFTRVFDALWRRRAQSGCRGARSPCLPWKQEIGGSNPPALTNTVHVAVTGMASMSGLPDIGVSSAWVAAPATRRHAGSSPARNVMFCECPRSSMDRAPSFYLGTVRVRLRPRAPLPAPQARCDDKGNVWRVGRAARHRTANAARPSGRAGSTPALSASFRDAQLGAHLNGRAADFDPENAVISAVRAGPGCGAGAFPLRLTAGRRTLNAAIVVRIHEGEPTRSVGRNLAARRFT